MSVAIITIPALTLTDSRNRLHCENGPAMVWLDAKLYYWHGVEVPWRVIEKPQALTATDVLSEKNAEVARVMLERIGEERFLAEAKPHVIEQDFETTPGGNIKEPRLRQLVQIEFKTEDEPYTALRLICPSTARTYIIRVPPTMQTCHQAAAWIAGFDDPAQYKPVLES